MVDEGHAILEMRHITKEFPGVKALDDVTMRVRRADIHAICGENGAGKSTLMKVLSGVYPAGSYGGEIVLDGEVMQFGGIKVLQEVSFAVEPGQIFGLVGPNGAGKTSLFNCISGHYNPTSGAVRIDGT